MYNGSVNKQKYYVVWKGRRVGIFGSWPECEAQVKGYTGAEYKAFDSRPEAERALAAPYSDYKGKPASSQKWLFALAKPEIPSIAVDAACSGSPGPLEYQGVETETAREIFKHGPFADGTNNVGEFLAIVEAMRWLEESSLDWPIYTDSENAIGWVRARRCNTKLERLPSNAKLFELIDAAEKELRSWRGSSAHGHSFRVMKWDTRAWGEIPADFGRK